MTIEKGNALLGGHIVNCTVKYNGGKMKSEDQGNSEPAKALTEKPGLRHSYSQGELPEELRFAHIPTVPKQVTANPCLNAPLLPTPSKVSA